MIVFPMAGLSRRFFEAGYDVPKYMLDVAGEPLFFRAVQGFRRYFESERFLFICRDVYETPAFVERQCRRLGITRVDVIALEGPTLGQADTVRLGLEALPAYQPVEALTIFNIDTIRRDFAFPWDRGGAEIPKDSAYVEVFEAEGDHWSFVAPVQPERDGALSGRALYTTEKRRVSSLCSTGLYQFRSCGEFMAAHAFMQENGWEGYAEQFVCPMYNVLIKQATPVYYDSIGARDLFLAGTPAEYTALLKDADFAAHAAGLERVGA